MATRLDEHAADCRCDLCRAPDGSLYENQLTGEWWQKRDGVWLLGRLVFEPRVDAGGLPEGQVGEPGSPTTPPASTDLLCGMGDRPWVGKAQQAWERLWRARTGDT